MEFNPRVAFRKWLLKPSKAEIATDELLLQRLVEEDRMRDLRPIIRKSAAVALGLPAGALLADEVDEFSVGVDCQSDGLHLATTSRMSVRIVEPADGQPSWRVELLALGTAPHLACYLAASIDAALKVAGYLLRGEDVPRDYRAWR